MDGYGSFSFSISVLTFGRQWVPANVGIEYVQLDQLFQSHQLKILVLSLRLRQAQSDK